MFDPTGPVLGIDPGLSRCGYGAVAGRAGGTRGSGWRAVSFGVIRTDPELALPERLGRLHEELEALIAQLRPSAVAVERVLFQVNVRTAMSVGQASGLALAIAARAGIPVAQYSPNEVKLAVAGYGNAEKAAVQTMVVRLLDLPGPPGSPDAADALALALCHAWGAKLHPTREAARGPNRGYEQAVAAAIAKDAGSR
ncbi:MAG TPA: crossover junction endodeoxyribonuclease RuvC [Acidimicrobiia bacterium]